MNYPRSARQVGVENSLERKEVVAMLMESPFYFDLRPRERLLLVRQYQLRFSRKVRAGNPDPTLHVASERRQDEMRFCQLPSVSLKTIKKNENPA